MAAAEHADGAAGRPPTPTRALAKLLVPETFTNLRRRKLTQVDVLSAAPPLGELSPLHVTCAAAGAAAYIAWILPEIRSFGQSSWQAKVAAGTLQARPGGPFAEVSLAYAVLLSLGYVSLSFLGVNRMAQRPSPVHLFLFECMAVHNVTQCLFNLYCFGMLLLEGRALGLGVWGNVADRSERGHALGGLIWLQYHCRQLQLLETAFMVLRKKFQGVSFLHLYLRVLNLWGWYIACRSMGGGEAYFPALVSSACQCVVYGLYFSFSLSPAPSPGSPAPAPGAPRAARIFELQIAQYVVCALHSIGAAVWGNFPGHLALLHLFVIGNGLVLYTDFHSDRPIEEGPLAADSHSAPGGTRRVTFSFDSCGWLMVYHFGAATFLSHHLGLEVPPDSAAEPPRDVGFSGSSGGSLVAAVLGAGTHVPDVFEYILEQHAECRRNPTRMFPAVERALRKFQYAGAHRRLTGRVRVLLTRVTSRPPFVMGEVADNFPDNETAVEILCASCHVPLAAGLLPRRIRGRCYYDGLLWPSRLLVPWRGAAGDHVVRVSACAAPLADVRAPSAPYWWALLPPRPDILRGIFWAGYRDMARWFAEEPSSGQPFDPCRCRRPAPRGPSSPSPGAVEDEGATARWRAARALLKVPLGKELLPEKDPATGQSVQELVEAAEAMAQREGLLVQRCLLGAAGVALAAGAAALPALLQASELF